MAEEIKTEGKKFNPWTLSTIILGALVLTLAIFLFKGGITGGVIGVSGDSVAQKGVVFLNTYVSQSTDVTLSNYTEVSGLYLVTVDYKGNKIPVYMTKDGEYIDFGSGMVNMVLYAANTQAQEQTPAATEVPKSDKPVLELFIMTHCPYGTQSEKALIPAYNLLKNKADIKVRFVHYFMHDTCNKNGQADYSQSWNKESCENAGMTWNPKESTETYTQLCIREEQSSKFIPYLTCFLEAGDSASCLTKAGIDNAKLTTCKTNKAKEYYAADSALSNKYGVQGSPTFILNGVEARLSRSPDAIKTAICAAFNTAPAECSQTLSTAQASAGFGSGTASASSDASCA